MSSYSTILGSCIPLFPVLRLRSSVVRSMSPVSIHPIEIVLLAEPDIDLRRCLESVIHQIANKRELLHLFGYRGIPVEGCPA
jgi:hypothetical protein